MGYKDIKFLIFSSYKIRILNLAKEHVRKCTTDLTNSLLNIPKYSSHNTNKNSHTY